MTSGKLIGRLNSSLSSLAKVKLLPLRYSRMSMSSSSASTLSVAVLAAPLGPDMTSRRRYLERRGL